MLIKMMFIVLCFKMLVVESLAEDLRVSFQSPRISCGKHEHVDPRWLS